MSILYADIVQELRELEPELKELYERDFTSLAAKSDRELAGILAVADALRDLRSRNYATRIFQTGLGIWEGEETPDYGAFAAACAMLGLSCLRLERLSATALAAAAPDVVCPRDEMGGTLDELYRSGALEQRPLALPRETALPLVLYLIHESGGVEGLRGRMIPAREKPEGDLPELSRRFGLVYGSQPLAQREEWAAESLRPYVLASMILLGKCPAPVKTLEGFSRAGKARRTV